MKIKRRSSSSSTDDDIPLKMIKLKRSSMDTNSYNNLCRRSHQACEFCDHISKSQYSSLVHNIKHIIIPLLNQTVFQCEVCLHHFTSQEDLIIHKLMKHPTKTIPLVKLVKEESEKKILMHASKSKLIIKVPKSESSLEDEESNVHESNSELDNNTQIEPIQNRLVFEDDIIINCDRLLNDLTTDCQVNLEVFKAPVIDDEFRGKSVHFEELVKPGFYRCKKCGKGFPIRYESLIHESSHITFKNSQVTLCIICDQYILGNQNNLRLHYLTNHKKKRSEYQSHHKDEIETHHHHEKQIHHHYHEKQIHDHHHVENQTHHIDNDEIQTYNYHEKLMYPHQDDETETHHEKQRFPPHNVETQTQQHGDEIQTHHRDVKIYTQNHNTNNITNKIRITFEEEKNDEMSFKSKTIMLCELCFTFCKNKQFTNFEWVGNVSEIGKRFRCEKCGNKYFELKLVKRQTIRKKVAYPFKKKKYMSNEDRLKIITNRFKMLKH